MGYSIMDKELLEKGPNFEGKWNNNCQICKKPVLDGQKFYKSPLDVTLDSKEQSIFPIVHALCLWEEQQKAKEINDMMNSAFK